MCISIAIYYKNKDENVHRFALSVIRGWLLKREKREKEKDRVKEREIEKEIVLGYYTRVTYHP